MTIPDVPEDSPDKDAGEVNPPEVAPEGMPDVVAFAGRKARRRARRLLADAKKEKGVPDGQPPAQCPVSKNTKVPAHTVMNSLPRTINGPQEFLFSPRKRPEQDETRQTSLATASIHALIDGLQTSETSLLESQRTAVWVA